jgi:hypothetical protein
MIYCRREIGLKGRLFVFSFEGKLPYEVVAVVILL